MKNSFLLFIFLCVTNFSYAQNKSLPNFAYVFTSDSLAGFEEQAAKNSAISEGFLGEEFKVRMWSLKRAYINSKYGITNKKLEYKNSSYTANLRTSLSAGCVNEDFEGSVAGIISTSNQITGWTMSGGSNLYPNTSCAATTTDAPSESEIITVPSGGYIDPVIGNVYPIYSVFGTVPNSGASVNPGITSMYGNNIIRINNGTPDYSIEKLSKTILVTPTNALFEFAFLAVFYTGHNCCDAGAFNILLTNATTNQTLSCPGFSYSAPSTSCPTGTDSPSYYNSVTGTPATLASATVFNKWRINSIDLSAYIGQTITIDIVATDCTGGAHYGYTYFDAQCGAMNIQTNNNVLSASAPLVNFSSCGATSFTIIAPAGLGPYSWAGIGVNAPYNTPLLSNQVFTTNVAGSYTLTMNPIGSCNTIITKVISIGVSPAPLSISISGNTIICPSASASLTVNGASTYTWSNGSSSNPVILSPSSTTTYTVLSTDANNCSNSAGVTVSVGPVSLSINGSNIICVGSSANFTLNGAASYSLNSSPCTNTVNVLPLSTTIYTITGSNGPTCSNTQTLSVYVNTTCANVWPGDANSDGIADNLDVLELGLHFAQTGAVRSATSNLWNSYFANNWSGLITNGQNLNHSDCNGDGVINQSDTLAIFNNYNLLHAFKPNNVTTSNPQITIVPDQNFVLSGQWGSASVYLGDATNSINSINGVAFSIDFDNSYLQFDSVYINYPVSFLNATNHNLNFRKKEFNNGVVYAATTHTTNTNVNGNGKIAVFYFKVNQALAFDTLLNLSLANANQSNAAGIITPLTTGNSGTVAIGNTVGLKQNSLDNMISVFPNPTKGLVIIKSNTEIKKAEILSITGQVLMSEMGKGNTQQLNLEGFTKGIYFIKIYNGNGSIVIKKIVTKD